MIETHGSKVFYSAPHLSVLGRVVELTASGSNNGAFESESQDCLNPSSVWFTNSACINRDRL